MWVKNLSVRKSNIPELGLEANFMPPDGRELCNMFWAQGSTPYQKAHFVHCFYRAAQEML